jgi:SAM-dependent methyltransferase
MTVTASYDLPNPDLLDRLPLTAGTVLDVGCGHGALGLAFAALNPQTLFFGIDSNPDVLVRAAERYHAVACADVEQDPFPFGAKKFDCLVYGDVLEHLREPWVLLRRHLECLNDDGVVLICCPNVEHWTFVARLIRGEWSYEESGLFDRTHLRWFSLESLRRGLEEVDLLPCDVHPRVFERDRVIQFLDAMAPTLKAMGMRVEDYAPRAAALQYVWRALKQQRERMTVVATMLHPVGGVSDLRINHPQTALATDPRVLTRVASPGMLPTGAPPEGPNVLILHRPALTGIDGLRRLQRLIADGWMVVTEFDDHPDHFESMQTDANWSFAGVHAVQTSTPAMAEILRERNPEVKIFPNAIYQLPEPRNFQHSDRITVFFGALNREQDSSTLIPVLNDLIGIAGDRLHFSVVHDQGFFDALQTPHKQFAPVCDYATYLRLLGDCEVSLMPLGDTDFNRAKSDLKFIEAGACRVAALASPVVYENVIEDGYTGLIFRTAEELRARLYRLIAVPDDALALGEAARDYVAQNRMMAYQTAERIAWYRSLWERRDELNLAAARRVTAMVQRLGAGVPLSNAS